MTDQPNLPETSGAAQGVNPYGGYTQAPAPSPYQGGGAPGSLAYVEAHFGPVANFGQRLLASLIDSALNLLGLIPFFIGLVFVITAAPTRAYDAQTGAYVEGEMNGGSLATGLTLIGLSFLLVLAIGLWNRIFRMGRKGRSVGKQVVGLKLVNQFTGQPIGAGSAFVREFINSLANNVVFLGFLWMLWDPNRQTLGDLVVKSTVISAPKS